MEGATYITGRRSLHLPNNTPTIRKVGCHKRGTTDEPTTILYSKQSGVMYSIDARPSSLFYHCLGVLRYMFIRDSLSGSTTSLMAPAPVYNTFFLAGSLLCGNVYTYLGGGKRTPEGLTATADGTHHATPNGVREGGVAIGFVGRQLKEMGQLHVGEYDVAASPLDT
jgi:hypothetical protein